MKVFPTYNPSPYASELTALIQSAAEAGSFGDRLSEMSDDMLDHLRQTQTTLYLSIRTRLKLRSVLRSLFNELDDEKNGRVQFRERQRGVFKNYFKHSKPRLWGTTVDFGDVGHCVEMGDAFRLPADSVTGRLVLAATEDPWGIIEPANRTLVLKYTDDAKLQMNLRAQERQGAGTGVERVINGPNGLRIKIPQKRNTGYLGAAPSASGL